MVLEVSSSDCCDDCWYFFFVKQKTAYEMRISDWSSDVCSSDLLVLALLGDARRLGVIRAVHVANAQPDRRRARFLVGTRMAAQALVGIRHQIAVGRAGMDDAGIDVGGLPVHGGGGAFQREESGRGSWWERER